MQPDRVLHGSVFVTVLAAAFVWLPAFNAPASAAVCCPSGCVPSGYGGGCWVIGTTNACRPSMCPPSGGGGGGGGNVGGGVVYNDYPQCTSLLSLGSAA